MMPKLRPIAPCAARAVRRVAAAASLSLLLTGADQARAQDDVACAYSSTPEVAPIVIDAATMQTMQSSAAAETDGPFSIFLNAGPGLLANPQALAAFRRAAAEWEAVISDPIRVTIDADLMQLESGAVGETRPRTVELPLSLVRGLLVVDGFEEGAEDVVLSIPAAEELVLDAPAPTAFMGMIRITKANTKALGVDADTPLGPSDGEINFNTDFLLDFDFDPSDGIEPTKLDFESVVVHEIGHLLGFVSSVDRIASLAADDPGDGSVPPPAATPNPLDLFRFATSALGVPGSPDEFRTGTRIVRAGVPASFDDVPHQLELSTGRDGDGRQASHWRDDRLTGFQLGVMDPTIRRGQRSVMTAADRRALDVIGWEIRAGEAPPEVSVQSPLLTPNGVPVRLRATASDEDGLGFPILLGFGFPNRVSFAWDFQGGTTPDSLASFRASPEITYQIPPDAPTTVFLPFVNVFDALGDTSVGIVAVTVSNPPTVSVSANGSTADTVAVISGTTVNLAVTASDTDGIGFPLFAPFGNDLPVSVIWDFGIGVPQNPLQIFVNTPSVRFSGPTGTTVPVSVTAFDSLGLSTSASLQVQVVNLPPAVSIRANGTLVTPEDGSGRRTIAISSPGSVSFEAQASDADGLGFPIFAAFGVDVPTVYSWSFGGGVTPGPLDVFLAAPTATFVGAPGTVFPVSLAVFDTQGTATRINIDVVIQ